MLESEAPAGSASVPSGRGIAETRTPAAGLPSGFLRVPVKVPPCSNWSASNNLIMDSLRRMLPISLLDRDIRRLSLLKPDAELETPLSGYPYLDKSFLESFATLEFTDVGTSVYRFRK